MSGPRLRLIGCLYKHKFNPVKAGELAAKYNALRKNGMADMDAAFSVLEGYHKELFDNLNGLKAEIGLKQDDYEKFSGAVKAKEVEKGYDQKIEEAKKPMPKVESAVIKIGDRVYEGKNHGVAMQKAEAAGEDMSNIDRERDGKFKTSDGRIIDRDQAESEFGARKSEELIPQGTEENSLKAKSKSGPKKENKTEPKSPKSKKEKEEPEKKSKDERRNDIIDKVDRYNKMRSNDPERPALLNEIRQDISELNPELSKGGKLRVGQYGKSIKLHRADKTRVQRRLGGTRQEAKDFNRESYSEITKVITDDLLSEPGALANLDFTDEGGSTQLSAAQRDNVIKDYRNGKMTTSVKRLHDSVENMVNTGYVALRDPSSGERIGIPLQEYLDMIRSQKEEPSVSELNKMLDEDFYWKPLDEFINSEEDETGIPTGGANEAISEAPTGEEGAGETAAGQTQSPEAAGGEGKSPATGEKLADAIGKFAEKVKNSDWTGAGPGALKSDITAIPKAILYQAIKAAEAVIRAGGRAIDAINAAVKHIKENHDYKGSDKDLEDFFSKQIVGEIPEFWDYDRTPPGGLVGKENAAAQDPNNPNFIDPGGGFTSRFIRNFGRLAAYDKALGYVKQKATQAAISFAGSTGKGKVILNNVALRIRKEFGDVKKANEVYKNLRKVLVQSNLNGLRDRYRTWADTVEAMNNDEMEIWAQQPEYFQSLGMPSMEFIAEQMQHTGKSEFRGSTTTLAAIKARKDMPQLREFMEKLFRKAGRGVANVFEGETGKDSYEELRKSPDVQKAKQIFWEEFGSKVEEVQKESGGSMREFLGEEGIYYPLSEVGEDEEIKPRRLGSKQPLSKPANPYNRFATGLAERYETSVDVLKNRVVDAYKIGSRQKMINTFADHGYLVKYQPGNSETMMSIGDKYMKAVKINLNEGRPIAPSYYLVPEGIEKDIRGLIYDKTSRSRTEDIVAGVEAISNTINSLALSTPVEAMMHTSNLLFRLSKNSVYAYNGSMLEKMVGTVPVLRNIMQAGHLLFMNPRSEKWQGVLQEMAAIGEVPSKFSKYASNKDWAEMVGAEHTKFQKFQFGNLLYGDNGVDIRARMMMYDIAKSMNPDATPDQMRKVMSTLGDYTSGLQSEMVSLMKETSGLAPFIVSQQARLRAGVNALDPVHTNLPLEGLSQEKKVLYHTLNLLNSSVYGYLALWATAFRGITGNNPFTTQGARLGVIPYGVDDEGKPKEFSIGTFYQAANIGTKIAGLDAYFKDLAESSGGISDNLFDKDRHLEAFRKGLLQSFNTDLAPVMSSSPVAHAAFGLFGQAPYVVSEVDDKGQPGSKFMPTTIPAPEVGLQIPFNIANEALHLNPLVGRVADYAMRHTDYPGFSLERSTASQGLTQSILDQFFPGTFVNPVNETQQSIFRKRLEQQTQKSFEREVQKQHKDDDK